MLDLTLPSSILLSFGTYVPSGDCVLLVPVCGLLVEPELPPELGLFDELPPDEPLPEVLPPEFDEPPLEPVFPP